MRKMSVILLVLLLSCIQLSAQQDNADVVARVRASGAALKSFECNIIQQSKNPMMKEAVSVKGKMYYMAPSCVRFEYTEPRKVVMVMNGSRMMMSANGKSQVMDMGANKQFSQMSTFMTGLVQGSLLDDSGFDCAVEVTPSEYVLVLVPVAKGMKKMFSAITVTYDRAGDYVSQIEMKGKDSESISVIKLLDMKKDVDLPAEIFNVE